jgi:hypothetical protein
VASALTKAIVADPGQSQLATRAGALPANRPGDRPGREVPSRNSWGFGLALRLLTEVGMTLVKASIATLALLALGSSAFAFGHNGGALPSVRKQVMAEARNVGVLNGLKSPGLRLSYSKGGKQVQATLTALSRFGGGLRPLPKARRVSMYGATFKVQQVTEGKIVKAVKNDGRVWNMFMHALGTAK